MPFAQSIPLSASNWVSMDYTYVNNARDSYDTLFFVNSAVTNFMHGLTGLEDSVIIDNSIVMLTTPRTILSAVNLFPSNFEEGLSGTTYSDYSISNTVVSSVSATVQYIIHYSLDDPSQQFNVITIPNDEDHFYKLHTNNSETAIFVSGKRNYEEHFLEADTDTTFVAESGLSLSTVFPFAKYGECHTESDLISANNQLYWLSANGCDHRWVQSTLLNNRTLSTTTVSDLLPPGTYSYGRMGHLRNREKRERISTRLLIDNFAKFPNEVSLVGPIADSNQYTLDGTNYLQVNWTDQEKTYENELKIDMAFSCLFKKGERGGVIVGNRNTGRTSGYMLSFNTGVRSMTKTIPFKDRVSTYNSHNLKNYDKDFVGSDLNIIAYGQDGSGIRWLYDQTNNIIHKLDIDNVSLVSIRFPTGTVVNHIETDFQNNLWIMNSTKKRFQGYDSEGKMVKIVPYTGNYDMFYIPILGNVPTPTYATVTDFDSKGNLYRLVGNNIRKNNDILFSFGSLVQDFFIDLYDRAWVFFGHNQIALIDTERGMIIRQKEIMKSISSERNARISGWNSEEMHTAQVLFMDNNIITEIDDELNVIQKDDVLITCERNHTFHFRGDWTGYKIGKRQNYISHHLYSGFASPVNPFLTLDFSYSCVDSSDPLQHGIFREHVPYRPYTRFNEWNGVAMSINNSKGNVGIYINGSRVFTKNFPIMGRLIRHEYPDNNRYNPTLIGASNGKIGTISNHIGRNDEHLQASIAMIAIYADALTNGKIQTIFADDFERVTSRPLLKGVRARIPTKPVQHISKLFNFLRNSYPGIQSNHFDVDIIGYTGDEATRDRLETLLHGEILKTVPSHVELRRINWK